MPSLPRIKRTRPRSTVGEAAARAEPRLAELQAGGLTWIHLDAPTVDEANMLADRFGWHPLDIEDVLSKRQRPKIDEYADEGYLFAVLHFPVYDKAIQRLNAGELDLFLGQDHLVTLPNVELLPVTRLFRRCAEDERLQAELFSKGSGRLLYEVLDDLFDYCFPILDKIGHKLDSIEDDMFEGRSEEVVRDISNVKQEIISYRKIIKPERSTLRLLERHTERFLPEALELYFDDIVDSAGRIREREVGSPIAVHVGRGDRHGSAGREAEEGLERAVAVSEQHGGAGAPDGEVGSPVAVEVGEGERGRPAARGVGRRRGERAVAEPEVHQEGTPLEKLASRAARDEVDAPV